MKQKDVINLGLFFFLACVIVIASKGGFSSNTILSTVMFNIGVSMIGGVVCGISLYGINFIRMEKSDSNEHFISFKRNKDMGEQYWIEFIQGIDNDSSTVWFVGNRHLTWIDQRLRYRKEVKEKFIQRVNRALKSDSKKNWEVVLILTDRSAVSSWEKFILNEIEKSTNYCNTRPSLISIGFRKDIPYSIVAHGGGLVITPYTSKGRAAASPTFEVKPNSEVGELYIADLDRIKNDIPNDNWWTCTTQKSEVDS